MGKNSKTYVLLTVVLAIWGIIGYKVYKGYTGPSSDTAVDQVMEVGSFRPNIVIKNDTFTLAANYRDPFLGTLPKKKKAKPAKVKPKDPIPEIRITYTGSVINNDQNNSIFFVSIEDSEILIRPKQTVNGVTLISGTEKQIRIRHNGKLRTIPLQK